MSQTDSSLTENQKREKWIAFVQALNPAIDPRAIQLMDEMRITARALYQIGEYSLTAAGLSYAKYQVLMSLFYSEQAEGRGELNPSEISRRQGTGRNTISALVRNLEEGGLIERHLDQNDRRKFNIRLTEAGRDRVRDHARKHFRIISDCFGALNADEQETLSQLLTKIRSNAIADEVGSD